MRHYFLSLLVALLAVTSLCALSVSAIAPFTPRADRSSVVPGEFLVQTDGNANARQGLERALAALSRAGQDGTPSELPAGVSVTAQTLYTYTTAIKGFAVRLNVHPSVNLPVGLTPEGVLDRAIEKLRSAAGVLLVEENGYVQASQISTQTVTSSLWSLDRVDQRAATANLRYTYDSTGEGVHVYVIDTGIRKTHTGFGGRADWVFNAFSNRLPVDASDGHGHGTHVAGTVGSAVWGVAKNVNLHAVKVLNNRGSGTDATVAAGCDFVAAHVANAQHTAAAVMSLGGTPSLFLDNALNGMIAANVPTAVAAGNENADACLSSPARVAKALTVASSDKYNARSSFSNWGPCVDLFAPGSSILSASKKSDTASTTMSGTSMAAPHVAGAMALYLQRNPLATSAQVNAAIVDWATLDAISPTTTAVSPNKLLFTLIYSQPQMSPLAP